MIDFNSEYQKLNPEQKLAVDTIEGPVMVIAGAGTGKTQTIALRIGKILTESQVNPYNILCLTFTESAALNMRQRLLSLIGSSSYSVRIATFHGFCNSIIKDHPEYFLSTTAESSALDDVSQIGIIQSLIDSLPGSSCLKNINSPYFYQKDILKSISTLKKENVTPDQFATLIDHAANFVKLATPVSEQLTSLRATAKTESQITTLVTDLLNANIDIFYQAQIQYFLNLGQSASQLKKSLRDFITKTTTNLPRQQELLVLYRLYQQYLSTHGFYDYQDMIIWVINAFKSQPQLLAEYQETYQYLLVDEFQDTNSAQFEIINQLTQNQESPNIFVVGDDDQSIYRFQGASVENVNTFYQKYKSTIKIVVLKNNYRSHRLILETSSQVISHNQNRITQYIDQLDKSLVSTQNYDPDPINLFVASSPLEENYAISLKIKKLLDGGVNPKEIAVLYRNNTDVDDLLPHLDHQNISYLRSDSINILENINLAQLITLLNYLFSRHRRKSQLAKILSFQFVGIPSLDLYKYFHHQEISPKSSKKIDKFIKRVAIIDKQKNNLPPDQLFNIVIRRFKFLRFVLKHGNLELLKQLNTLYSHLKTSLKLDKVTLKQWLKSLQLLQENYLPLNSPPLISQSENSIRLMTAHKAKGLEFEHVFLIKTLSGKWDGGNSRELIKLPLGIIKTEVTTNLENVSLEEDRRLFYVALTRAKKQIYLSYSSLSDSNKEQLPCIFLNEIDPKLIEITKSSSATEQQSLLAQFSPTLPTIKSVDLKDYLSEYLSTRYRFNITHLNSYLKCPLCFFFKTILRLPQAKTRSLSFGTSVHGALAYLYQTNLSLEKFLEIFDRNLKKENLSKTDYQDLLTQGHQILTDYYHHYQGQFNQPCLIEHDFKDFNVRLDEIPLTGKIDRIDLLDNNQVNVVDYKTGRPDSKYQQLSKDGDYFRQLVFYKILCDQAHGFKYQVNTGTIDFVQADAKGQFKKSNFQLTKEDTDQLSLLIKDVYQKITSLQFPIGSDCPDPDHLHLLFEKYFKN
ncbi:MAG TPA: ATP-dependent DNA helicase [Candidatus Woesebacteria bacterium]|nr:ATP-dependent DNA helicase [Candidatus Woesebacteria bacterium]